MPAHTIAAMQSSPAAQRPGMIRRQACKLFDRVESAQQIRIYRDLERPAPGRSRYAISRRPDPTTETRSRDGQLAVLLQHIGCRLDALTDKFAAIAAVIDLRGLGVDSDAGNHRRRHRRKRHPRYSRGGARDRAGQRIADLQRLPGPAITSTVSVHFRCRHQPRRIIDTGRAAHVKRQRLGLQLETDRLAAVPFGYVKATSIGGSSIRPARCGNIWIVVTEHLPGVALDRLVQLHGGDGVLQHQRAGNIRQRMD